jgi:hypothetical protein
MRLGYLHIHFSNAFIEFVNKLIVEKKLKHRDIFIDYKVLDELLNIVKYD